MLAFAGRLTLKRGIGANWRPPRRLAALSVILIVGIAIRVWAYRAAVGVPDSDEAVVGLMARHILHGEFTTFFLGQEYGGSQEALLTAPLFSLFGSSWLALRLIPMMLSAVAALVIWRIGRRALGERAAIVAGILCWVWPPYLVYELTHQWGFYASGVVYSALLLLLALRVDESPTRSRCTILGLVIGLALWDDIQLVPVLAPLLAWIIWRTPRTLRHTGVALAAALLGALPSLLWNLHHHWGSLQPVALDSTTYQYRLRIFVSPLLPMLLGLRTPFTQEAILGTALTDTIYLVLIGLAVYGAYRSRRSQTSLFYWVAAGFPIVYAISPRTDFVQSPRYLLVLSPVIVLLLAQLVRSRLAGLFLLSVCCAVSAANIQRMNEWTRTVPSDPPLAPRNLTPLVRGLDRLGITTVYATYWVAYRLDFDTHERIVAAENRLTAISFSNGEAFAALDPHCRYPKYTQAVAADPNHGFILFDRQPGLERRGARREVTRQLLAHGYRAHKISIFTVFSRD